MKSQNQDGINQSKPWVTHPSSQKLQITNDTRWCPPSYFYCFVMFDISPINHSEIGVIDHIFWGTPGFSLPYLPEDCFPPSAEAPDSTDLTIKHRQNWRFPDDEVATLGFHSPKTRL